MMQPNWERTNMEPQGLGFGFASFGLDPEAIFQQHLYYTMGDFDLF